MAIRNENGQENEKLSDSSKNSTASLSQLRHYVIWAFHTLRMLWFSQIPSRGKNAAKPAFRTSRIRS
jgi:hypothetical protein